MWRLFFQITWRSDGQVAPLQLDLVVRNWQPPDESVNLQLGHTGSCNVQSDPGSLNCDFTGRGQNEGLDGVVIGVDHAESSHDVDEGLSGSGLALNDQIESDFCGERKSWPLNRGRVNEPWKNVG